MTGAKRYPMAGCGGNPGFPVLLESPLTAQHPPASAAASGAGVRPLPKGARVGRIPCLLGVLALAPLAAAAQEPAPPSPVGSRPPIERPSLPPRDRPDAAPPGSPGLPEVAGPEAAACASGPISSIEIESRSIFEPSSAGFALLRWAYQAANLLHVNTQESFIERELLFDRGDCFDPFLVAESERLLDQYGFLASARVRAEPDGAGGQIVRVETRDEWSTKVDFGATYDEGFNVEKLQVTEENLLGHGVFGEFTYVSRREVQTHSIGVSTPRFFGRADAGLAGGRTRGGAFFEQYVRYPFVGEAGRISVREGYRRGTNIFAYATGGAEAYTRTLLPVFREQIELSGAHRFGEPGASVIVGVSLTRDRIGFEGQPEVTPTESYDDRVPYAGPLPGEMLRQMAFGTATRVGVHLGTRRFRYVEYVGLDGVRDRQNVGLGFFLGASAARSLPIFTGDDPRIEDLVARLHGSFTAPLGSSLLHGGTTVEARQVGGGWRDVLAEADLVFYGRSQLLPGQTWFLRASAGGGWHTTLPFQLSLGGREAVRALPEDVLPGGRMLLFVVEDRIVLPWPDPSTMDLGLTLFADAGRVLPGDVPYGIDSGWQGSAGFGLRLGLPSGTRNIWRADVVFPVGSVGGPPMFRLTFELNKLRSGFFNPEIFRSRRFLLGPETF